MTVVWGIGGGGEERDVPQELRVCRLGLGTGVGGDGIDITEAVGDDRSVDWHAEAGPRGEKKDVSATGKREGSGELGLPRVCGDDDDTLHGGGDGDEGKEGGSSKSGDHFDGLIGVGEGGRRGELKHDMG
jgi:hypothetical protein